MFIFIMPSFHAFSSFISFGRIQTHFVNCREGGPRASRSTTRADRGYISRLGKRASSRLGEGEESNGEGERDYLGLEEKIPWIRLRKKAETGGDAVPWVRLKKAGRVASVIVEGGEAEVDKVWYV